jgi:quinolinate synthase
MSENARAMLDAAGFDSVPVYRLAAQKIGCSLADAAASPKYHAYLQEASQTPNSLHVIYVNTGLDAKALANRLVPTITCTSSNVVQVILQAAAQIPDINIWYGPDTYMGENLYRLFASLLKMDEYRIRELHPVHSHGTIGELLKHYHYYKEGACIVHELFGQDVVERIARDYNDAFLAAHLEVPGEMFESALECQRIGTGVVGSTANILQFVSTVTREAVLVGGKSHIKIILGTESGMITSVVRRIRKILGERIEPGANIAVEVIFPVAPEAITTTSDSEMKIVPGVSGNEGCSLAGGCAICPYMKMNSVDALFDLLEKIDSVGPEALAPLEPKKYHEGLDGRTVAEIGGETILHMQAFQESKMLSEQLILDIRTRNR